MIVKWLPQALLDRERQIRYIFAENPKAAIALDDLFRRQTKILEDHPESGRIGRHKGTRELVVPRTPFIMIYRINRKGRRAEILRLLHGAQKWLPRG